MMKFWIILIILFYPLFGNCYDFSKLDSIVASGIQNKYYPGAQVLIGNADDIIYMKSYGQFTYSEDSRKVSDESIFDLASVTKVVATTTAIMNLYNSGKIDLNDYVEKYLPEFNSNGKNLIKIANLLLHNSGLKDWIPFYQNCKNADDVYKIICEQHLVYPIESDFVYSDLNFILLGFIVEKVSGQTLDEFCKNNIFEPLKMQNTFFKPDFLKNDNILPTEIDNNFRKKTMQGEVHDENAFIMGGVSGHAGLFSNSKDLYIFMKMILMNGKYEDDRRTPINKVFIQFVDENIVDYFTTKLVFDSYKNTRAFGWDTKPAATSNYRAPCGELFSEKSFGHTGFTGTSVWCDKEKKLIVIFLTNRTFPDRNNNGIKLIRPDLHNEAVRLVSN